MLIVHALALACLNIGANISFGKITGSIAGVDSNIDHLAIYSSLADMGSSFFGGGPVEAIISGTATAPNPIRSSVMMMLIMAAILLFKLLPTIGKYVHSASIAGFLFVLGTFVTFATNIQEPSRQFPRQTAPSASLRGGWSSEQLSLFQQNGIRFLDFLPESLSR